MTYTKKVKKSYLRDNLASIVSDVEKGQVYYVSDRGYEKVALVPISLVERKSRVLKKLKPISQSNAFGIFADKNEMKDSVAWVRNLRESEVNETYAK